MAIKEIVLEHDEFLRKKSHLVTNFNKRLWGLLDDMKDTLRQHEGVGLAAVQIGTLRRVIIIDVGDGLVEYINPEIIEMSGEQEEIEGCLSIPGERGYVKRPAKVVLKAQDRNGAEFVTEGEELLAIAMSHEIDHLDGIIYKDKVTRMVDPETLEEL